MSQRCADPGCPWPPRWCDDHAPRADDSAELLRTLQEARPGDILHRWPEDGDQVDEPAALLWQHMRALGYGTATRHDPSSDVDH
jgi:hypothetical protein